MGFSRINTLGVKLPHGVKGRITPSDFSYFVLLKYLENVVNNTGYELVQELEVVAQTNEQVSTKNIETMILERRVNYLQKSEKKEKF